MSCSTVLPSIVRPIVSPIAMPDIWALTTVLSVISKFVKYAFVPDLASPFAA